MVDDGRFIPPSVRAPGSNDEYGRGLWFVASCEYWVGQFTQLEEEHPERSSRENAEQATRLTSVFDADLKKTLQQTYRTVQDGSEYGCVAEI